MEALKAIALPLGFGFHPTDVELISHYLKRKNEGRKVDFEVIPELDIYKREPWDLPACCQIPTRDSKWHFFTSRDRKYPTGSRSNRATEAGYWKSTGKDRKIKFHNWVIGAKKTLVFHEGRPPYGKRTNWIMHEFFMEEKESKTSIRMKDTYVLCRVTKRNGFAIEENVSAHTEEASDCRNSETDLYPSLQEVVTQQESSQSKNTEDLDAWFKELLFDGSIDFNITPVSIESKSEAQDEPLECGFWPQEIINILHDDFTAMPEINEFQAVDHNATTPPVYLNQFGTEDFKKEMPGMSKSSMFTGKQMQESHEIPAIGTFQHNVKLQVQTRKMESRNSASVSQTIKSAQVDYIISTNSMPRQPINIKVEKKRDTIHDAIKGLLAMVRTFLPCI